MKDIDKEPPKKVVYKPRSKITSNSSLSPLNKNKIQFAEQRENLL